MSTQQFDRVAYVDIGPVGGGAGTRYEGLRITFNIEKDASASPNKARIEIYNLKESSRAAIEERTTQVRLYAGYRQDTGAKLIFAGIISYASTTFTGSDVVTALQCGDGLTTLRDSRTTLGLQPGAAVDEACKLICKQVGLPLGSAPASAAGLENGFAFTGQVSEALRQLSDLGNMDFSIQDEQAYFSPCGEPAYNAPTFLVSPSTGLLDSPARLVASNAQTKDVRQRKKKQQSQFSFRCLLNPQLIPNARTQLESRAVKGLFRLDKVRHVGDTHGADWLTECEVSQ